MHTFRINALTSTLERLHADKPAPMSEAAAVEVCQALAALEQAAYGLRIMLACEYNVGSVRILREAIAAHCNVANSPETAP